MIENLDIHNIYLNYDELSLHWSWGDNSSLSEKLPWQSKALPSTTHPRVYTKSFRLKVSGIYGFYRFEYPSSLARDLIFCEMFFTD